MMAKVVLIGVVASVLFVNSAQATACYANGSPGECISNAGACMVGYTTFYGFCSTGGKVGHCCVPETPPCPSWNPNPQPGALVITPTIQAFFTGGNVSSTNAAVSSRTCGGDGEPDCSPGQGGVFGINMAAHQFRWGNLTGGGGMLVNYSGLGFTEITKLNDPNAVDLTKRVLTGEAFPIGAFYHFNMKILQTSGVPASVTLVIRLIVQGISVEYPFNFGIDESPNTNGSCPQFNGSNIDTNNLQEYTPCPDRIRLLNAGFSDIEFMDNNTLQKYTMKIVGFKQDVCAEEGSSFWITQEDVVNVAFLYGVIVKACPPMCLTELIIVNGACVCSGDALPTVTAASTAPALMLTQEQESNPVVPIAVGATFGVVGLIFLGIFGFLLYNRVTTGSWLGNKKRGADNQVASNPLYQETGGGDNPLYSGQ